MERASVRRVKKSSSQTMWKSLFHLISKTRGNFKRNSMRKCALLLSELWIHDERGAKADEVSWIFHFSYYARIVAAVYVDGS